MKMPEPQFVDTVMPSMRAPSEPATCTPWLRKRWMRPGPLTTTAFCAFVVIPTSPVVTAPPHPVTGSPLPVIVYPLSLSSTPGTPNDKHGVPSATAQVMSPVPSVLATIENVLVMVPETTSGRLCVDTATLTAPRTSTAVSNTGVLINSSLSPVRRILTPNGCLVHRGPFGVLGS